MRSERDLKKNQKKIFFSPRKALSNRLSIQKSKKNFFWVKSAFSFYRPTDQCFVIQIWSAVFDREINGGDFDSFTVKIRWGEHLHFYRKKRKTSTRGRFGTNGSMEIFVSYKPMKPLVHLWSVSEISIFDLANPPLSTSYNNKSKTRRRNSPLILHY